MLEETTRKEATEVVALKKKLHTQTETNGYIEFFELVSIKVILLVMFFHFHCIS